MKRNGPPKGSGNNSGRGSDRGKGGGGGSQRSQHGKTGGQTTKSGKKVDRHEQANTLAASAIRSAIGGRTTLTLDEARGADIRHYFAVEKINNTIRAVALINAFNQKLRNRLQSREIQINEDLLWQFNAAMTKHVADNDAVLQLREPHVGREDPARLAERLIGDLGDMDARSRTSEDLIRRGWHLYARETPSHGYKKLTGRDRPHTPQWIEFGSSGITSRIIYDYWNDLFYITPHYNEVPEKGFTNPYVLLEGANQWTLDDVIVELVDGLRVIPIEDDGHCLFRAVATLLNDGRTHLDLRQQVADQMEGPLHGLVPDGRDPAEYAEALRQTDKNILWGGDPELQALSYHLRRRIIVHSPSGPPMVFDGIVGGLAAPRPLSGPDIHLYHPEGHFDALTN